MGISPVQAGPTGGRDGHTTRNAKNDRAKKSPAEAKARKGKSSSSGWVEADLAEPEPVREGDPNFVETSSPENTTGQWVVPVPSAAEFKATAVSILTEYLSSGDCTEVARRLEEARALGCGLEPELVKRSLLLALDRKERDRESVSRLLVALSELSILTPDSAAAGFALLLSDSAYLDDLVLDTPDAIPALSQFVARAIVDEVLVPAFLDNLRLKLVGTGQGTTIIEGARTICKQQHSSVRIAKIWGPGDGRPAAEMKLAIKMLIGEYTIGLDLDEATRCVRELDSPYFLHECVKQGIVSTIDKVHFY